MLAIVGCGPRGLAICIAAHQNNIPFKIIDPRPLHTWSAEYIVDNIQMRSPITFDLVTFVPELQEFSLAKYLNLSLSARTQEEIEANTLRCDRNTFRDYLSWVYKKLDIDSHIIKQEALDISASKIKIPGGYLDCNAVVIASGEKDTQINIPSWVRYGSARTKLIDVSKITNPMLKYLVIGSGQRAVETACYLQEQGADITLSMAEKSPRIDEYPSPSYRHWGERSALGGYYSLLKTDFQKIDYLSQVKKWQPSITPSIKAQLSKVKQIDLKDTSQLEEYDHIVLATSRTPILPVDVDRSCINSDYPQLSTDFESSESGIYFTGLMATMVDGPRQNSVISAGLTAQKIINHYRLNYLAAPATSRTLVPTR